MSDSKIVVPIEISRETAVRLYSNDEFQTMFGDIQRVAREHIADTSTTKGRDEIRALARKIVTTRVAVVKMGKDLTEDWRTKTAKVNKQRGEFESQLDALASETRQPLTDWEMAEEKRKEIIAINLQKITALKQVALDVSSATIKFQIAELQKLMLQTDFQESEETAELMADSAIESLQQNLVLTERREAVEAENVRMKAEREKEAAAARVLAAKAEQEGEILRIEQAERDQAAADKLEKQEAEFAAIKAVSDAKLAAVQAENEAVNQRAILAEQASKDAVLKAEADKMKAQRIAAAETAAAVEAAERKAAREKQELADEVELNRKQQETAAGGYDSDDDPRGKPEYLETLESLEATITVALFTNKPDDGQIPTHSVAVAICEAIIFRNIPHVSVDF